MPAHCRETIHCTALVPFSSSVFIQSFWAHSRKKAYEARMPGLVKSAFVGSTSTSKYVPPAPHTNGWILDRLLIGWQIGQVSENVALIARAAARSSSQVVGGRSGSRPAALNISAL